MPCSDFNGNAYKVSLENNHVFCKNIFFPFNLTNFKIHGSVNCVHTLSFIHTQVKTHTHTYITA